MEYMAPNMPQQNGVMEWKIAMDRDHAYAMLLATWLIEQARHLLRAEAESTAMKLSNLAWNQQVKDVPNDLFNGQPGHLSPMQLIELGQIGYAMIQKQIKKKWVDKSMKCIMVGYLDDHSGDTYWMYDPVMNTIRNTWDVRWAAWMRTDPTETMRIFANSTKPTAMAGASDNDQLPVMTMTIENDNDDDSNDKVFRKNVNNNDDYEAMHSYGHLYYDISFKEIFCII